MKRVAFLSIAFIILLSGSWRSGSYSLKLHASTIFHSPSDTLGRWYVNEAAQGNKDGSSWDHAFTDLQLAIDAASAGDTLWVAQGKYEPSKDTLGNPNADRLDKTFYLNKNLHIYGGFQGVERDLVERDPEAYKTILEHPFPGLESNPSHVLILQHIDTTARLDGLVIKEPNVLSINATGSKSAVAFLNSTPIVQNCDFIQATLAKSNATIEIDGGRSDPLFINCYFSVNGGNGILGKSSFRMVNSIFEKGKTTAGALIRLDTGQKVDIVNCTFSNNEIAASTGVVHNVGVDTVNIINCVLQGNGNASLVNDAGQATFTQISNSIVQGGCPILNVDLCDVTTVRDVQIEYIWPNMVHKGFRFPSAAWNKGNTEAIEPYRAFGDHIGQQRIKGGRVDIGATEYQGDLFFVSTQGNDENSGTSWTEAFASLNKAIAMPSNPEPNIIWIAKGTYHPLRDAQGQESPADQRSSTYFINKPLYIFGSFVGDESFPEKKEDAISTVLSGEIQEDNDSTNNAYHLFDLSAMLPGSTLFLDGVSIRNGNAKGDGREEAGGGIYNRAGSLHISNCRFEHNVAGLGGGLYNEKGIVTLEQCTFQYNYANHGAAIYNDEQRIPLPNVNFLILKRDTFKGNLANMNGGAMSLGKSVNAVIESSAFLNNRSLGLGGGIYLEEDSRLEVDQSLMFENRSNGSRGVNGGGGAIGDNDSGVNRKIKITNTTISNNVVGKGDGGGLYLRSQSVEIRACHFIKNRVEQGGNGGALFADQLQDNISISSSQFVENRAPSGSGGGAFIKRAYSLEEGLEVVATSFSSNYANKGGGVYLESNTRLEVHSCQFQSNTAITAGAGIFLDGNLNCSVQGSFFLQNATDGTGGAFFCEGNDKLRLVNNLMAGCSAVNGAAVYNKPKQSEDFTEIINCTVFGNRSNTSTVHSEGNARLVNSIIWGNESDEALGGDIRADHCIVQGGFNGANNLDVDPLFQDTGALDFSLQACSRAINAGDSLPILQFPNQNDLYGNSRIWSHGNVDIGAVEFQADIHDGKHSIYIHAEAGDDNQRGRSWPCAFSSLQEGLDAAKEGDTLWVAKGIYVPSRKWNNTAGSETFLVDKNLTILGGFEGGEDSPKPPGPKEGTILSGQLDNGGGSSQVAHVMILDRVNSQTVLDGLTFEGGWAKGAEGGGGLLMLESDPLIQDCLFQGNSAKLFGGALLAKGGKNALIRRCRFVQNGSDSLGGAIYTNQELTLQNCLFTKNSAEFGGAFFADTDRDTCRIVNSTFSQNKVGGFNGIIQVEDETPLTIDNSIVWGNNGTSIRYDHEEVYVNANLLEDGCNHLGLGACPGEFNLDQHPLFTALDQEDYTLQQCSPAVGAGNNDLIPLDGVDLLGADRLMGNRVDLGAFEFAGMPCITTTTEEGPVDSALKLELAPVPTSGKLSISFSSSLKYDTPLKVVSAIGQTMRQLVVRRGVQAIELDLSALPYNLYFIQIQYEKTLIVQKIIVNN